MLAKYRGAHLFKHVRLFSVIQYLEMWSFLIGRIDESNPLNPAQLYK